MEPLNTFNRHIHCLQIKIHTRYWIRFLWVADSLDPYLKCVSGSKEQKVHTKTIRDSLFPRAGCRNKFSPKDTFIFVKNLSVCRCCYFCTVQREQTDRFDCIVCQKQCCGSMTFWCVSGSVRKSKPHHFERPTAPVEHSNPDEVATQSL